MAEERDPTLSLAFMRAHPAQAARVLEAMPAEQAAPLFERTPARLGAAVLAAMLPRQAAGCVGFLGDERTLALLAAMSTQGAVGVLRQLPEPRRRALIAGLPTAAAALSTLLLGYAEHSVGAWADPDVLMARADLRAGEALERIRQASTMHPLLCVTDAEQRLLGTVALAALLRTPDAATLGSAMQRPVAALRAHAPLTGALAHSGWQEASALPVVGPGERLVGLLTRDALSRALRHADPARADASRDTAVVLLGRVYWSTLSGLAQAALPLLPRVRAIDPAPARDDDGR